jgi:S1-C subfamily serine protease
VRIVAAPDAPSTPARTPATGAPPRTPVAGLPAAGAPGAPLAVVLSRREVDGALADFSGLATAIRGGFSANGLRVDDVNASSLFYRAGLRAGDVVTAIDGARLRTLDDAANLYARAATAKTITAQLVRGGKPVTLHVVIQ